MSTVTVTIENDVVQVHSPYDPGFPPKARRIGGVFDKPSGVWKFDIRDEDRARELCREIYGTDGADRDEPAVTVRFTVTPGWYNNQEVRVAGRRLAWRAGRDWEVQLAAGVIIAEGGFPGRGGSVKNPRLANESDVVLEIRDVPLGMAQKMVEEYDECCVILESADFQRQTLIAERDALLAKLAEVDAKIAKL